MGFEPVTSRYRFDALTNCAIKPLTLGAGHLRICVTCSFLYKRGATSVGVPYENLLFIEQAERGKVSTIGNSVFSESLENATFLETRKKKKKGIKTPQDLLTL